MDKVISLVSSDEEDADDSRKLNANNIAVKKKKINHHSTVLTEISTQKTSPNILKRPESIGVRVPQNNHQNQKVTVLHGFKNKLSINPMAPTNVVKSVTTQRSGNMPFGTTFIGKNAKITPINATTGRHTTNANHSESTATQKNGNVPFGTTFIGKNTTITSINAIPHTGNANHVNHGKLNTPKPTTITAATHNIPKTNSSMKISPAKVVTTLASSTATLSLNPKDDRNNSSLLRPVKRIQPIKISESVNVRSSSIEKSSDSDSLSVIDKKTVKPNKPNETNHLKRPPPIEGNTEETVPSKRPTIEKNRNRNAQINADYQNLIEACKAAESSQADMKKVVEKLESYYHRAPPDYVNSPDFCKLVKEVTLQVRAEPTKMYFKLIDLMAELKTRRADCNAVVAATTPAPAANPKEREKEEKRERRIQQLSDALRKLQQRIRKYEQAEVDWDAEKNSSFMITERLKERAYTIYVKLCDLTGENKNAERTVKKPIKFKGTDYKEFNKKLEKYVNEKREFPDMFDVLSILDYCNKKYGYRLDKQHRHSVATVAFGKIGDSLQERRKRDLYEMVQYHTCNQSDPAREDESLKVKLEANHKHYSRLMNDVIEKYTLHQRSSGDEKEEREEEEEEEEKKRTKRNDDRNASISNDKNKSSTVMNKSATSIAPTASSLLQPKVTAKPTPTTSTSKSARPPPPPPRQTPQSMKMDVDLDINDVDDEDESDLMIIPDMLGDEGMQEIAQDLFPQISSVTSLHPANLFETNPLENGSIL